MFDVRYHVASLAAVFLALVIGILVGVGLSGKGFVDDAERTNLEGQIRDLRDERDQALGLLDEVSGRAQALDDYATTSYGAIVGSRLAGTDVGVVFVGRIDQGVAGSVRDAVTDAGGRVVRTRALRVPLDGEAVDRVLRARPALPAYAGEDGRERLGRDLGRELVAGEPTPLLDRLAGLLVQEQEGSSTTPVDAVVVARPVRPQRGETQDFLTGLYRGVATAGVPAVGIEGDTVGASAVPAFARGGLSTVAPVEPPAGKAALVLLLGGAQPGSYGLGAGAADGILPPLPPVVRADG